MKLIALCCFYALLPFLVFYSMEAVHNRDWHEVYYLWDKSKDCLLFFTLYRLSYKWAKGLPLIALNFSLIRLLWHIITVTFGITINHPVAINTLFAILVAAGLILMVIELRKKWSKERQ